MIGKTILFVIVAVASAGVAWWVFDESQPRDVLNEINDTDPNLVVDENADDQIQNVRLEEDGTVLVVEYGQADDVVTLTISDFNDWSTENWDEVFTTRPAFGEMREVAFTDFPRFDRELDPSPDGRSVAFSVSDYAALATLSFVGLFTPADESVELIPVVNQGSVGRLEWSADGSYVALVLHTARAQGDGLVILDMQNRTQAAEFDGAAVGEALGLVEDFDPNEFLPRFEFVQWINDTQLVVSTRGVEEDEVEWVIDATDPRLQRRNE